MLTFCQKNLKIRAEKTFLRNNTHFTANLPPLAVLEKFKFFWKSPPFFSKKKSQILNVLRNLTISVRILRQIFYKLVGKSFTFRGEQAADVVVNAIGKHRVKKGSI